MKKLIFLTLICFVLAGVGNVFSRSLSIFSQPVEHSSWAMFKELFH